jgi:hypothetical protein
MIVRFVFKTRVWRINRTKVPFVPLPPFCVTFGELRKMENARETPMPACTACGSHELRHELADRWQCLNCGYRLLIDDAGRVRDFMPWRTAGRRQGGGGSKSYRFRPGNRIAYQSKK